MAGARLHLVLIRAEGSLVISKLHYSLKTLAVVVKYSNLTVHQNTDQIHTTRIYESQNHLISVSEKFKLI